MTTVLAAVFGLLGCVLLVNLAHLAHARHRSRHREASPTSVSILIPARNEARNLQRLLPTLLGQTWKEIEIIVYDDDSNDDTWQVLSSVDDPRVRTIRGGNLPPGWIGKVDALFRATRVASNDLYLFLDADTALKDERALERLVAQFQTLRPEAVLTGLTRVHGGGQLLVSLVPFVILAWLPLPLAARLRSRLLSGLNGQCWMIDRDLYHRLEPHLRHRAEVLEDIHIGRYLKANGVTPHTLDLQREVEVFMYRNLADAWRGFRKNVYPFMGESPWSFVAIHLLYITVFLVSPFISPWFLVASTGLKLTSDRFMNVPLLVTAATPFALLLGALLQLDSAVAHWSGRAMWKNRPVAKAHLQHSSTVSHMVDAEVSPRQD